MEITLTPDIEQALTEQARQQGTTPEQLALDSLRRQFVASSSTTHEATAQGTLADFLAGSVGVLHSSEHVEGGAQMSQAKGTAFVGGLHKKRQQGHLLFSLTPARLLHCSIKMMLTTRRALPLRNVCLLNHF